MSPAPDITISMRHIRTAKLCSSGTRAWFEQHGFDWTHFLEHGIEAERLVATGDALAFRVIEIAKKESC